MEADEIRVNKTTGLGGTEIGQPRCAAKPGKASHTAASQPAPGSLEALPGDGDAERAENVPFVGEGTGQGLLPPSRSCLLVTPANGKA